MELKNSMNKKRTDFNFYESEHIIEITPYWLLGFTEGDGSFNITNTLVPQYNITQSIKDRRVMEEIQKYFKSIPKSFYTAAQSLPISAPTVD